MGLQLWRTSTRPYIKGGISISSGAKRACDNYLISEHLPLLFADVRFSNSFFVLHYSRIEQRNRTGFDMAVQYIGLYQHSILQIWFEGEHALEDKKQYGDIDNSSQDEFIVLRTIRRQLYWESSLTTWEPTRYILRLVHKSTMSPKLKDLPRLYWHKTLQIWSPLSVSLITLKPRPNIAWNLKTVRAITGLKQIP